MQLSINKIIFIIGASGAGKTSTLKSVEANNPDAFKYCYFDNIGVPTAEEMVRYFGSGENWQKETTKIWVKKIKDEYLANRTTILDGQINPTFIEWACKESGIKNYEVILFDCSDEKRSERLVGRGHPELVNAQMMNWAKYLREESLNKGYRILDNTNINKYESVNALLKMLSGLNNELNKEMNLSFR